MVNEMEVPWRLSQGLDSKILPLHFKASFPNFILLLHCKDNKSKLTFRKELTILVYNFLHLKIIIQHYWKMNLNNGKTIQLVQNITYRLTCFRLDHSLGTECMFLKINKWKHFYFLVDKQDWIPKHFERNPCFHVSMTALLAFNGMCKL